MIISNASPLMYLAKLKKISLLELLFREITIPSQVYEEVVILGKKENFADAFTVEQAKNEGWLVVENISQKKEIEALAAEIDFGEAAVIALARKHSASLLLMDDASARTIAESFGFKVKGTLFVLLRAYKKKIIGKEEVRHLLAQLVREGFRISQELYVQVLEEIEKS